MIVDVNVLVHATREGTPAGLPWASLSGFIRLSTHPRLFDCPLTPAQAHAKVDDRLAAPPSWPPLDPIPSLLAF